MGDKNYEIIKPHISITSYYERAEKKVPLALYIHSFSKNYVYFDTYSLGGDEGMGFFIEKSKYHKEYKSLIRSSKYSR